MLKNIAGEYDRAINKKGALYYIIGILAVCIIANVAVVGFRAIYGTNEGTYAYNIIEYGTWSFILPYLTCIFISDMVFGKDYSVATIQDGDTGNLSKPKLYLSKLIAAFLLAMTFVAIAFLVFLGTTALFQMSDKTVTYESIRGFSEKMFIAIPLWLAGISFGMMFLFAFCKKRYSYIAFYIMTLIIPQAIIWLAKEPCELGICKMLRNFTLSHGFALIPYPSNPDRNVLHICCLGFAYAIIANVVGIIVYMRKPEGTKEFE